MATKFKMAAIFQNNGMSLWAVTIIESKKSHICKIWIENDAKQITAELHCLKRTYANFTFQNGRQSVLKLTRITYFIIYRCFVIILIQLWTFMIDLTLIH